MKNNQILIAYFLVMLKNIFVLGLFVLLAIHFGKWWLSLLGILFWSTTNIISDINKKDE